VELLFARYGTLSAAIIADIATQRVDNANQSLQHQADYLRGEVAYLAHTEKVIHLDDFVLRRASLAMLGLVTLPLLEELAVIIGEICGWSAAEQQAEVERSKKLLAERHRVRL